MSVGTFASPRARTEFDAAYEAGMRALPAPADTRDVPTDFGTVRVYRFGPARGAPIVLLPGRSGTTVMWLPNLAAFAEHHPVYALDLLGEPGRSEQTAPIRDAADQAVWLGTVLAALDLDGVHLVGVSIGGWHACNLAVRVPDRLASVSLVDPANTLGRMPAKLVLRAALAGLPLVSRWGRPAFLSWIAGGATVPKDDPATAVLDAGMRGYRMRLPVPEYFTDDQLRSIRVPVLALIAGRSAIHHPEAALTRARTLIPHVHAELWPTATHAISGSHATEVNAAVLRFITEVQEEVAR
ncbi:alpha/beta fold hydrolase [Saccharothrix variisporea]|uniref:Pimeloyl-ACP methyl ester carboxylesterase n=1 Tax=Saccharothrix variisporea TaxID=543527 RepID=A0A495XEB8_9PSEU|nr:alpha/beta hydrolase [Saccharothrix variisporea]RKT71596.1 pimeloyl-ACP methyl ester carboxylesterase [Saccharothrix variisporea]